MCLLNIALKLRIGFSMANYLLESVDVNFSLDNIPLRKKILSGVKSTPREGRFQEKEFRALRKIDLKLEDGDRLALIGGNGAGKTTLLRTLAGIYEPCSGNFERSGSLHALLNVTAGMEMNLSGRENLRIKALHMGLSEKKIKSIEEDVLDFANLGSFIDVPVVKYSSGMVVRLAFAISTAIRTDILLLDEWLSAGDASFLEKSEKRMKEFVSASSILVFASHAPDLLINWCNKAIVLEKGEIAFSSNDVESAIEFYSQ